MWRSSDVMYPQNSFGANKFNQDEPAYHTLAGKRKANPIGDIGLRRLD